MSTRVNETVATIEQIKIRHGRACDSTKGAAEWLADYALDAHEDRGILLAKIEQLMAALKPFCSGDEWGTALARISVGAPSREEGIAMCKQIVKWQCAADEAFAGIDAAPGDSQRGKCSEMVMLDECSFRLK